MLTQDQINDFQRDGYLIIPQFASPDEILALKSQADHLLTSFDPSTLNSVFSTTDQKKTSDTYFLDSASSIGYFWEEKARDPQGNLLKPKEQSINKIGHALHDLDPVYRSFSRSPKFQSLLRSLGFSRPLPVQSMLIFKQPGIGGEVVPHQDATFLATEPQSVVGLWLALEDATTENSCLWTLPGSHTTMPTSRRMVRRSKENTNSSSTDTHNNDKVSIEFIGEATQGYNIEDFMPVQVPAGSLVLLHGQNLHMSGANTSPHSRYAYTVHVVESGSGCRWLDDNWLQRRGNLPFEPIYNDDDDDIDDDTL